MNSPRRGELGVQFELLGLRLRFQSVERELLADLCRAFGQTPALGPLTGTVDLAVMIETAHPDGAGPERLRIRTWEPGRTNHPAWPADAPLPMLVNSLNQWIVGNSPTHGSLHAAAVARGGRALLLPAVAGAGKSTLTTALVQQGFALLSDEVAAFNVRTGRLEGYPRPLILRPNVLPILGLDAGVGRPFGRAGERMVAPEEIGGERCVGEADVSLIVLPQFQPSSPVAWTPRKKSAAVLDLMQASAFPPLLRAVGFEMVTKLVGRVETVHLAYPNLAAALERIEAAWARLP